MESYSHPSTSVELSGTAVGGIAIGQLNDPPDNVRVDNWLFYQGEDVPVLEVLRDLVLYLSLTQSDG